MHCGVLLGGGDPPVPALGGGGVGDGMEGHPFLPLCPQAAVVAAAAAATSTQTGNGYHLSGEDG